MKEIHSEIDNSVNFIIPAGDKGFYEARYVRRADDYFICYLSSHSGCNKGCSMCWLTTTKQTMMKPADRVMLFEQYIQVFNHYKTQPTAKSIHFNWMARGEPLDNLVIDRELLRDLAASARLNGLIPKFKISTIMPQVLKQDLVERFCPVYPSIYYSLYSMDKGFRDKWLPAAMDPNKALDLLKEYQEASGKIIYLHGAIIAGENDSIVNWMEIRDAIRSRNLMCRMNIVRYNPPVGSLYEETEERNLKCVANFMIGAGIPTRIVPRVGFDVKASCGTFLTPEEY